MGVRENKVETLLHDLVTKLGGTTRKWVCPTHTGVPDRIVFYRGIVWFVEVKTVDGNLSTLQAREISRLRNHQVKVFVVYGEDDVRELVAMLAKAVDE